MTANSDSNPLSQLPSVDRLLQSPAAKALVAGHGHQLTVARLRFHLQRLRNDLLAADRSSSAGVGSDDEQTRRYHDDLLRCARQDLESLTTPGLRAVFNLTGTVLHTNLGRAPLPAEAVAAINRVAATPANLEFNLATGQRGDRDDHVEPWLCRLTGAEAATVVNNNAAAVMLVLNTLANGREVPVSRGELVEIGGSFRMPEIMRAAGCKLVEIGTTNCTHRHDYEAAVGADTAMVLRVHTSNYQVQGFTASVAERELAALTRARGIPLVYDLGSGSLLDFCYLEFDGFNGFNGESTPKSSLANGVDIVTFSGDKMLGGPQCGVIAGRRALVERIKRNPMKRAMRCDKLTVAALQALLPLYADTETALQRVPALRLIGRPVAEIEQSAKRLLPPMEASLSSVAAVSICPCQSQVGSGALPTAELPSFALRLTARPGVAHSLERLAADFRALKRPVLGRIHKQGLQFDLRCLEPDDEAEFVSQLSQLGASEE